MNDDVTTFPLSYPVNQPRTMPQDRRDARFTTRSRGFSYGPPRKHSVHESARELELEIRRMGGKDMIISSNLRVKANGLPYSGQKQPDDPGVAVYFKWHKRDLVFACDKWRSVEDNLWAIVKHIEALRGQERWGVGSLDQAFAGYMQLPDPGKREWWEVLQVAPTASNDEIRQAYLRLAKQYHPDAGGDAVMFDQVQKAFDLVMGKRGA
ncbi:MAG: J domain-containing protein [Anaerolineales bacterium]|nr:J domain-containing protein [Anaerolineales bacterium]